MYRCVFDDFRCCLVCKNMLEVRQDTRLHPLCFQDLYCHNIADPDLVRTFDEGVKKHIFRLNISDYDP